MSDSTQTFKTLKLSLVENSRRLHSIEDSCSRINNELLQISIEALIFLKAQKENQFKLQRAVSDKELNQEMRSDIEPEPDPDIYGIGYPEQLTQ